LQRSGVRPFTLLGSGRRGFRTASSEHQSKHCEYHGLEALKGPSLHGPSPLSLRVSFIRSPIKPPVSLREMAELAESCGNRKRRSVLTTPTCARHPEQSRVAIDQCELIVRRPRYCSCSRERRDIGRYLSRLPTQSHSRSYSRSWELGGCSSCSHNLSSRACRPRVSSGCCSTMSLRATGTASTP
jgi:hypothetical protein